MVTGALFLTLVLLAMLLGAFIYQIVTTPLAAVDAPTLVRAAAAAPPAPVPPARQPRAATFPAPAAGQPGHAGTVTGPAPVASPPRPARGPRSWVAATLVIAGLAAVIIGGGLFVRIAHGTACSHQAVEVCSQGFVLLTGTQLSGGALAVAGLSSVLAGIFLALRYRS